MSSAPSQIAFITGANQGIGLATAKSLARDHGYHVIIGSRNLEAGEKAAADIRAAGHKASAVQLDLNKPESIESAVSTIKRDFGYLDVLINNAGILIDTKPEQFKDTWDLYSKTLETNVTGPAVLTEALLPLLKEAKAKPARLVFVSTTMASITMSLDKTTPWYPIDYTAYDVSKAAVNMLMSNFDRKLQGTGTKVNVVCPGLVSSNLTQHKFGTTTEEGAIQLVKMATLGEDGPTGTFTRADQALPW
ncbi:unnamed protein product [Clonostachys rosea f. rosea IK726]|jgi:NAD(P)-dependent dehydrogenase (short-subunit alcohol dehydrogenase family)|uniref:Uncharacterized protein n=2 Tax=Bionectria ochroleuca TaxID=29856 RepID=A0A0B7K9Z7_BIOOC|nr:unnamed protein product [Clonostachys rosea f. rosea IK726]